MPSERAVNWRHMMQQNIAQAAATPFVWGQHDCALFAASHIFAVTGEDLGRGFKGRYFNSFGAIRVLKNQGFEDLLAFVRAKLSEVPNSRAHVGDLALVKGNDTGWAIGIYLGEAVGLLAPIGYGIISRSDKRIQYSFAVGYIP